VVDGDAGGGDAFFGVVDGGGIIQTQIKRQWQLPRNPSSVVEFRPHLIRVSWRWDIVAVVESRG
jgi:hypothetical protein